MYGLWGPPPFQLPPPTEKKNPHHHPCMHAKTGDGHGAVTHKCFIRPKSGWPNGIGPEVAAAMVAAGSSCRRRRCPSPGSTVCVSVRVCNGPHRALNSGHAQQGSNFSLLWSPPSPPLALFFHALPTRTIGRVLGEEQGGNSIKIMKITKYSLKKLIAS